MWFVGVRRFGVCGVHRMQWLQGLDFAFFIFAVLYYYIILYYIMHLFIQNGHGRKHMSSEFKHK